MKRSSLALSFSLSLSLSLFSLTPVVLAQVSLEDKLTERPATVAPAVVAKRPIRHTDYDSWRSIVGTSLSRDGKWVLYTLQPQDGDGELVIRATAGGQEYRVLRGQRAQFSSGSNFVLLSIAPTKAEIEQAKKDKKPAPTAISGLLSLSDGKVSLLEKVQRASFADESDAFLFLQKEAEKPAQTSPPMTPPIATGTAPPAAAPTTPVVGRPRRVPTRPGLAPTTAASAGTLTAPKVGTELVVREMATGKETSIADVLTYTVTEDGKQLLYVVREKDKVNSNANNPANSDVSEVISESKNGVYVRDLLTSTQTTLATAKGEYTGLVWDRKGTQAAFEFVPAPAKEAAKDAKPEAKVETAQQVFLYALKDKTAKELALLGVPEGLELAENAIFRFSKDGGTLTLPLAKKSAPPRPKDATDIVNVDLWNWKDGILQPMQKVRSEAEKKRTYTAIYRITENKLIPIATPDLPDARVDDDIRQHILASTDLPYQQLTSWDTDYRDYYLVDAKTGERRKVLEKQSGGVQLSPDEKWLLWWDGKAKAWMLKSTEKDSTVQNSQNIRDLTGKLPVGFAQEDWDTPGDPAPYGVMGWTRDNKSVLLYDRYDVWEIALSTGVARKITNGRLYDTAFRYVKLETGKKAEEPGIPTDSPLLFTATNDSTKATGYWNLTERGTKGYLEKIGMWDKKMGDLQRAQDGKTVVFTEQTFNEFPDLWLASDLTQIATKSTRISDANPQKASLNWGNSELIEYINGDGKTLRAILTKPEDFDPNKKYPLLVYIYEELTNNLHNFTPPRPGTSINISRYVSNGYVVLQPDITYNTGYPGEDAEKCVLPAVQTVLRQGYIDPKRVGIQGHSWGAYQITHLITHTNIFRAVEAGASVSNMVSAYGGIRWESGMSRAFQYEKTQSRIGGTPWSKPMQFLENSPIFWADKVQTPYLTIHNDADGAVPWQEGIAFFTALRRLGKEAYLFNYNGEGHGLTGRENQKHWTVHMAEFFDHYLLNAPRPEWMDKGVPYLERGTRDLSPFYGHPGSP